MPFETLDKTVLAMSGKAKNEKYARKTSSNFSVQDDLTSFHIYFSRRKLCAFVLRSFLLYVFTKPPPSSSPRGSSVRVAILMELGLNGGFNLQ